MLLPLALIYYIVFSIVLWKFVYYAYDLFVGILWSLN